MSELAQQVLLYLREQYEDIGPDTYCTLKEISEDLDVPEKELYDFDSDSGALFELTNAGKVCRYGFTKNEYSWQASGANLVWRD